MSVFAQKCKIVCEIIFFTAYPELTKSWIVESVISVIGGQIFLFSEREKKKKTIWNSFIHLFSVRIKSNWFSFTKFFHSMRTRFGLVPDHDYDSIDFIGFYCQTKELEMRPVELFNKDKFDKNMIEVIDLLLLLTFNWWKEVKFSNWWHPWRLFRKPQLGTITVGARSMFVSKSVLNSCSRIV